MSVWRVTLHDMTNSLVFWKANFTNVLDPKAQGKVTSQPFGYTGGGNEWESPLSTLSRVKLFALSGGHAVTECR